MPVYKDETRNTWYASFYYTDWKGNKKLKKKRGFTRKKDALDFEREFLLKEQSECDMTFQSLYELYLQDMNSRLKATTIDNKKFLFESKILPYFATQPINTIKATSIRKWQSELMNQGEYSQTYLKTMNNQRAAIFNYAVKYYGLSENPCRIAGSMGKKNADEMLIWTMDEFQKFISVVDKKGFRLAFEILFWGGLRSGECLALTPNDILDTKEVRVCKTLSRRCGEDMVSEPKTSRGNRCVTIPDFLYDELKQYMSNLYGLKPTDRIFYFSKTALNKSLDTYARIAGVKRIRVHDLRHSHVSMLIEMGYNALLLAERLGHENIETTLNTYGHLYPSKQIELAVRLNEAATKLMPK